MNLLDLRSSISELLNLSKIKIALIVCFSVLMLTQFLIGFREFEDYLVILIFILFLNDLYAKIKYPERQNLGWSVERMVMSIIFFILFLLPLLFDSFNFSNATRLLFFKLGFILWAQVFLIDSYLHYNKTQSKRWLVFANTAVLMIIFGAFAG